VVGEDTFVRFESVVSNRHGVRPGVFTMVNWLAQEGRLTPAQRVFRDAGSAWFHARLVEPSSARSGLFGDGKHFSPTLSWFRACATELIDAVAGYLAILDDHGLDCSRVETDDPGRIAYSDDLQVVAVPHGRLVLDFDGEPWDVRVVPHLRAPTAPGAPYAPWNTESSSLSS
jgi:hypothetical protein